MRAIVLVFAALILSAEAPAPDLHEYETALAQSRLNDAAEIIMKLIQQRTPADGQPRPDALLNSLIGRLDLAARQPQVAATYLRFAPLAELPSSLRASTALAHGRVLESLGDRPGAITAFRDAQKYASSENEVRQALLGIARQMLITDPAAVQVQLLPLVEGKASAQRWEADYLAAMSASLLGDRVAAERFADAAWADSPSASLQDLAPLNVAVLRAGLAAASGDQAAERAMLMAANGLSLSASRELSAQIPVCGDGGLKPSDFVTFAFAAGPFGVRRLLPVAASRTAAIAPLTDGLAGIMPVKTDGYAPVGTVFTVSCRSVRSSYFQSSHNDSDPLLAWFVARGIYPVSPLSNADDKELNAVADRVDALRTRFGSDSPLLIEARFQLATLLERRGQAGDTVPEGQIADLTQQVAKGLRGAGAPEWIAQTIESREQLKQAAAAVAADPSQANSLAKLARDQLMRLPFRYARQTLLSMAVNFKGEWPRDASQLVLDMNQKPDSPVQGVERQAWLLQVAEAQKSLGDSRASQATLRSAGLASDLCVFTDSHLELLDQKFSYTDYPPDLIAEDQEGSVLFDFVISSSGTLAGHRVLYSLPSGLFNSASEKGLASVRYTAPKHLTKPTACRGVLQPVVWRLEGSDDFTFPEIAPAPTSPTS